MPHLLVAITAHGYGHLAQSAPVINALRRRIPGLKVTLYTDLPGRLLNSRIEGDFALLTGTPDLGMRMHGALNVDIPSSILAYQAFHRDYEQQLRKESLLLKEQAPDLVLANVPYLTLEAAAGIGIPALAMCSLNWADIYAHYCQGAEGWHSIHQRILAAYNTAAIFLKTEPCMPMPGIVFSREIGPIARLGMNRREEINRRYKLSHEEKLILVSMGGIPTSLPVKSWPVISGVNWIVPQGFTPHRRDFLHFEDLGLNFVDILCSSDILLTKPGYGSFTEAACNDVAVLYVPRADWPEEPFLTDWLRRHGRCEQVGFHELSSGAVQSQIEAIITAKKRGTIQPTGITQAVETIMTYLT